ncbi:MAG TPA: helix-turn-helix domain-containing protein [Desulfomonilaceae bacterium]|nr:helix-turn-helix domain-containing protein [Desulfomonilaceae bacterium]
MYISGRTMFPIFQVPTIALRSFIQFYIHVERSSRDPLMILPIPARTSPMLEFVFGDRFKVRYRESRDEVTTPATALVGMLTRPHATLLHQGAFQSFVIMFQVNGLTDLFGVPSREVTNHTYDADAVLGKPLSELEQRLGNCNTFQQRVAVANHYFAERLKHARAIDRMAFAADQILSSSGKLSSADLGRQAGIGVRQFQREFSARFGASPKLFSRIVRFQNALDTKARSSTKSWTDVAHELGYYDQMHMVHDFREFTDDSPTETLRRLELLFRAQVDAVRTQPAADHPNMVRRFVI